MDSVVYGGFSGLRWIQWFAVDSVVCGGFSGLRWIQWFAVDSVVCGGCRGLWLNKKVLFYVIHPATKQIHN